MLVDTLKKDFVIIALDYSDIHSALQLVDTLGEAATFYKVGMELFYTCSWQIIDELKKRKKRIFLDLKIHDIPATMAKTVKVIASKEVDLLTVFCEKEGIEATTQALKEVNSNLKILNVTVLTSVSTNENTGFDNVTSPAIMFNAVLKRATFTCQYGGHGVICSGLETEKLRKNFGAGFIIVNPGIRLATNESHDQVRVTTPSMAWKDGATHIVVGRPITQAKDPLLALYEIYADLDV